MTKRRTHGNWDPGHEKMIFLAGSEDISGSKQESFDQDSTDHLAHKKTVNILYSLRDFTRNSFLAGITIGVERFHAILLDSGVFGISMDYAKAQNISPDKAITTPLRNIPGWPAFFDYYVEAVTAVKDAVWGYVELDLGGREQKIETRARLEAIGLAPIPVWHPLSDGLDYGRHLIDTYDRVCVGNIGKSDRETRKVILQAVTLAQRGPRTWIHALGLGPTNFVTGYRFNSMDATSFLGAMRWKYRAGYSLMHPFIRHERYFDPEVEGSEHAVAYAFLERQAVSIQHNWRSYERSKLGLVGPHTQEGRDAE